MADPTLSPTPAPTHLGLVTGYIPSVPTPASVVVPGGILNDAQIRRRCLSDHMIKPFVTQQVSQNEQQNPIISYGLSSAGYDVRLGYRFKVANTTPTTHLRVLDPKNRDASSFIDFETHEPLIIPPHGFVLGETLEYFKMPRDLLALAVNKSTYARCATITLTTPAEPGWEGILTLEIANFTALPIIIYPGEGITQLIFLTLTPCETSYADKKGKYQFQSGVQEALV